MRWDEIEKLDAAIDEMLKEYLRLASEKNRSELYMQAKREAIVTKMQELVRLRS